MRQSHVSPRDSNEDANRQSASVDLEVAGPILERARMVAIDCYDLTGKPLGITGEYMAALLLDLKLQDARSPGL